MRNVEKENSFYVFVVQNHLNAAITTISYSRIKDLNHLVSIIVLSSASIDMLKQKEYKLILLKSDEACKKWTYLYYTDSLNNFVRVLDVLINFERADEMKGQVRGPKRCNNYFMFIFVTIDIIFFLSTQRLSRLLLQFQHHHLLFRRRLRFITINTIIEHTHREWMPSHLLPVL